MESAAITEIKEENPTENEVSIANILSCMENQSQDVKVMRHCLQMMLRKKDHQVSMILAYSFRYP